MVKKKLGFWVFIFVFFLSSVSTSLALEEISLVKNNRPKYVPDEVLVKYKEGQVNLASPGFMSFVREFKTRFNNDLTKDDILEAGNIVVYKIKDGRSVEEVIDEIKQDTNVETVQPNYYSYFSDLGTNDTEKANLWGLDNTGQTITFDNGATTVGTVDADIDTPAAWAVSVGTSEIIVAVIDTGVAYEHPDLIDNMWDGTVCVDENGDPLGGCLYGYDYGDGDDNPAPETSSHGTHVAGIIAGKVNNSIGIAGVGQKTKIMALRCENSEGNPTTTCIINSINFARQNGAKVINASFSGSVGSNGDLTYDAIASFRDAGGIFVAAAGNEGTNNDVSGHNYPSDYDLDNIISVAATDNKDELASFSSYGATSVDVGAPGVDILSSVIYKEDYAEYFRTPSNFTADVGSSWSIVTFEGIKGLLGDGSDYPDSYNNNSDYYYTSNVIDFSSIASSIPSFNFIAQCGDDGTQSEGVAAGDYMALEVSGDGTNFNSIGKWNEASISFDGGSCSSNVCINEIGISIPSGYLTNNFKYRFRWVTDSVSNNGPGCFIYNLRVIDYPTNGVGAGYDYMDGTSMATPYVTGLAAYLLSVDPSATYTEARNSILNNGDTIPALEGKTTTGRRVNAYNSVLALVPDPTVPGTPTGVGATAGDTEVTLNWTAPTDDGGSTILDYQIEYTTSGVGWTLLTTSVGTTKNITSLTNDQLYSFRISARNSVGTGSTSATVSVTPTATITVPGIPTGVGATAGDAEITLNWTAPANNGGAAITDYRIEYTTSGVGWTIINDGVSTNTTKNLVSLINDQEYSFRISAINSVGVGSTSTTVSATPTATPEDPTVPGIPTGVGATAGDTEVTLNWTAPANNGGATITDYRIEYTTVGVGWTIINDGVSTNTTKTLVSLINDQEYSFRISAINSVGVGSTSTTVSATPTAVVPDPTVPGIPTGVGATAGDTEVTLNWTAPADDGGADIIDYKIYYTDTLTGSTFVDTSIGTTAIITSLTNDQLYSFTIGARNSVGVGATSAAVNTISVGETGVSILIDNDVFVIPVGESSTSTSQITVANAVNINIGESGTLSQVQLTEDTIITEINDEVFDANQIEGASLDATSVSNLLTDYTARALIQWGISGVTLKFDKPILIKINVGSSYDGQTLSVFRSLSVLSGWTTDGLVNSTCLVANGICSFSTSQASYFTASTYSGSLTPTPTVTPTLTPTPTPTSAPSSSSSSEPPGLPACTDQVPLAAPNLFQITAGTGKATLYYAPINFTTTGYSILYGFTEGDERFGTVTGIMNNNEGVQSLTINDLGVGTYYFKVSANNGCASGPWSSWVLTKIVSGSGVATASATASGLPLAGNTVPTVAISLMALTSLAASWVLFKR